MCYKQFHVIQAFSSTKLKQKSQTYTALKCLEKNPERFCWRTHSLSFCCISTCILFPRSYIHSHSADVWPVYKQHIYRRRCGCCLQGIWVGYIPNLCHTAKMFYISYKEVYQRATNIGRLAKKNSLRKNNDIQALLFRRKGPSSIFSEVMLKYMSLLFSGLGILLHEKTKSEICWMY